MVTCDSLGDHQGLSKNKMFHMMKIETIEKNLHLNRSNLMRYGSIWQKFWKNELSGKITECIVPIRYFGYMYTWVVEQGTDVHITHLFHTYIVTVW